MYASLSLCSSVAAYGGYHCSVLSLRSAFLHLCTSAGVVSVDPCDWCWSHNRRLSVSASLSSFSVSLYDPWPSLLQTDDLSKSLFSVICGSFLSLCMFATWFIVISSLAVTLWYWCQCVNLDLLIPSAYIGFLCMHGPVSFLLKRCRQKHLGALCHLWVFFG